MSKNIALILAAGIGSRMNNDTPKQFMLINGEPLLFYSLSTFNNHDQIDEIYVVTNIENLSTVRGIIRDNNLKKVRDIIIGGKTRQESVFNGLKGIPNVALDDIILIHDSARPLVTKEIIDRNIDACLTYNAVNTVIPVTDSLVRSEGNESVDRNKVLAVQTPQTFRYDLILKAHEEALKENITNAGDDASLVSRLNVNIKQVQGNKLNFKVTTMEDLIILKAILER